MTLLGVSPQGPHAHCRYSKLTGRRALCTPHETDPRHSDYPGAGPGIPALILPVCYYCLGQFSREHVPGENLGSVIGIVSSFSEIRRSKTMSSYVSFGPENSLSQLVFYTQTFSFIFMINFWHVTLILHFMFKTPF